MHTLEALYIVWKLEEQKKEAILSSQFIGPLLICYCFDIWEGLLFRVDLSQSVYKINFLAV